MKTILCSSGNAFSYDTNGSFVLNTAYIMTGISLRYLLAILNSNTILFYLDLTNQKLGEKGWRWLNRYVERLPIPKIPEESQRPFVELVDRILKTKSASPSADTAVLEAQIDELVYGLYGLTDAEIAAVEGQVTV